MPLDNLGHVKPDIWPGLRVIRNASLAVVSAVSTPIPWTSAQIEAGGDFQYDSTVNTRMTCSRQGRYLIGANAHWTLNATGFRTIALFLNNTTIIAQQVLDSSPNVNIYNAVTTIYNMKLDDYIEVLVTQNTGGNLNLLSASPSSPVGYMNYIGQLGKL